MLFDLPETEKKPNKNRRRDISPKIEKPLPEFRPPPMMAAEPLGQIDGVYECLDQKCLAELHDILEEYAGHWRIECVFCGTGQRVKAIVGHLKPKAAEFTFPSGDYAGVAISTVAQDVRGLAYIEWAAEEHKSQPVKAACKAFLDGLKAAH